MFRNKKGQLDYPIITFVVIVFGLILLAPIILKIFISVRDPVANALGNASEASGAKENFNTVINTGINLWDKVIAFSFILAVLLLFVSAFLIDSHPFFVILYIFISFMLILFAPDIVGTLDNIYNSTTFSTEVASLSFIDSVRTHFAVILIGVMLMTGIIIYGKVALFSSGGRRR